LHGTRYAYQRLRCACLRCRAAEANYRARLRARHLKSQPIMGSHADPQSTWRQVRAMRTEGFTKTDIALRSGIGRDVLSRHRMIRLRTALLVSRFYRAVMAE
jgi:hypothetical protein